MSKQQEGGFTIHGKYVVNEMKLQMLNACPSMYVLPSVHHITGMKIPKGGKEKNLPMDHILALCIYIIFRPHISLSHRSL